MVESMNVRSQRIQEVTGELPNNVLLDMQALLENSLLVSVSVHGAGIFNSGLKLEELGIDSSKVDQRLRAGARILDPKLDKMLNSWSTLCRKLLTKHTMNLSSVESLTGSPNWRILMLDKYADFKADWDRLNKIDKEQIWFFLQIASDGLRKEIYESFSARGKIIAKALARYDDIVQENIDFSRRLARDSWRSLQARYTVALNVGGKIFGPYDEMEYIDWVETRTRGALPSKSDIWGIFAEYSTSILFSSADLAQEQSRVASAELETVQAMAEIELIHNQAFLSRAQKDAIRQAEVEKARESLKDAVSPLKEAFEQLLESLSRGVQSLISGYAKHHTFKGRSLDTARGFLDLYKMMGGSLMNDQELETLILDLTNTIQSVENPDKEQRQVWHYQIVEDLKSLKQYVDIQTSEIANLRMKRTRASRLEL